MDPIRCYSSARRVVMVWVMQTFSFSVSVSPCGMVMSWWRVVSGQATWRRRPVAIKVSSWGEIHGRRKKTRWWRTIDRSIAMPLAFVAIFASRKVQVSASVTITNKTYR